jgi:hypothetical protein
VEHRALEDAQQILPERQGQQLVGGEGRVADLEAVEEAVAHPAIAFLAHHRKAGEHQRVEIAVDGAPDAAEILGQLGQSRAVAAVREALDQPPLSRELITSQVRC